nr:retrovirus-related Pol polyprotein from transposon TNT 1-94 [Tanacetum cinerariifolium]
MMFGVLFHHPENQTVIGTKWVFKNKLDEKGAISRNKARLVAQGYNQQEGIDFELTYAPMARLESTRILLAYACANDFKLFQMDVKKWFYKRRTALRTVSDSPAHQVHQAPTTSTLIADSAPIPTNSSSHATYFPISSQDVDELNSQQQHAQQ